MPESETIPEIANTIQSDGILLVQTSYHVDGGYGDSRAKPVVFNQGDFTFYQAGTYFHSVSQRRGAGLIVEFDADLRDKIAIELNPRVNLDEPRTATSGLRNGFAHEAMLSGFLTSHWDAGPLRAQSLLTLLISDMCATLEQSPRQRA